MATAASAGAATCYVAIGGNDDTAEKDNPDQPYASVAAAVGAAAADDVVSVGEGTFPLKATLVLDKTITVRGAGRGKTTICRDPSVAKLRLVKMTAEATLADLTLSGGYITAKEELGRHRGQRPPRVASRHRLLGERRQAWAFVDGALIIELKAFGGI